MVSLRWIVPCMLNEINQSCKPANQEPPETEKMPKVIPTLDRMRLASKEAAGRTHPKGVLLIDGHQILRYSCLRRMNVRFLQRTCHRDPTGQLWEARDKPQLGPVEMAFQDSSLPSMGVEFTPIT